MRDIDVTVSAYCSNDRSHDHSYEFIEDASNPVLAVVARVLAKPSDTVRNDQDSNWQGDHYKMPDGDPSIGINGDIVLSVSPVSGMDVIQMSLDHTRLEMMINVDKLKAACMAAFSSTRDQDRCWQKAYIGVAVFDETRSPSDPLYGDFLVGPSASRLRTNLTVDIPFIRAERIATAESCSCTCHRFDKDKCVHHSDDNGQNKDNGCHNGDRDDGELSTLFDRDGGHGEGGGDDDMDRCHKRHHEMQLNLHIYAGRGNNEFTKNDQGKNVCVKRYSPIVMDFANNGIALTPPYMDAPSTPARFDIEDNGHMPFVAWLRNPNDPRIVAEKRAYGWLARDIDQNGRIDNGGELFGTATLDGNGNRATDGCEALKQFDLNGDGILDASEMAKAQLAIWHSYQMDGGVNGRTPDAGSLESVAAAHITSIALSCHRTHEVDPVTGSLTKLRGLFSTKANAVSPTRWHAFYDIWLTEIGE
jgi:hypothetical protein